MNIKKMEFEISKNLNKLSLPNQCKLIVRLIRYLNETKNGDLIAQDIFVSSIRAVQKLSVNEAIVIGEELIDEIFSIAVIRRMIVLYVSQNNTQRATQLLEKLPLSDWNTKMETKINRIEKQNQSLLEEESNESKFSGFGSP